MSRQRRWEGASNCTEDHLAELISPCPNLECTSMVLAVGYTRKVRQKCIPNKDFVWVWTWLKWCSTGVGGVRHSFALMCSFGGVYHRLQHCAVRYIKCIVCLSVSANFEDVSRYHFPLQIPLGTSLCTTTSFSGTSRDTQKGTCNSRSERSFTLSSLGCRFDSSQLRYNTKFPLNKIFTDLADQLHCTTSNLKTLYTLP